MCGRYYVEREMPEIILKLVLQSERMHILQKAREINPTDYAPVIISDSNSLSAIDMKWGMTGEQKGLLINARAETILDRKAFTESVLSRRCVVPASYFFEWDMSKNKCKCRAEGSEVIYMAGIYKKCDGEDRFTILTTAANESMKQIHDRMPLCIEADKVGEWINEGGKMFDHLKALHQPGIRIEKEYEQLSFFGD